LAAASRISAAQAQSSSKLSFFVRGDQLSDVCFKEPQSNTEPPPSVRAALDRITKPTPLRTPVKPESDDSAADISSLQDRASKLRKAAAEATALAEKECRNAALLEKDIFPIIDSAQLLIYLRLRFAKIEYK
jgi:hypothetical protein